VRVLRWAPTQNRPLFRMLRRVRYSRVGADLAFFSSFFNSPPLDPYVFSCAFAACWLLSPPLSLLPSLEVLEHGAAFFKPGGPSCGRGCFPTKTFDGLRIIRAAVLCHRRGRLEVTGYFSFLRFTPCFPPTAGITTCCPLLYLRHLSPPRQQLRNPSPQTASWCANPFICDEETVKHEINLRTLVMVLSEPYSSLMSPIPLSRALTNVEFSSSR